MFVLSRLVDLLLREGRLAMAALKEAEKYFTGEWIFYH